jgi:hypothetical protein
LTLRGDLRVSESHGKYYHGNGRFCGPVSDRWNGLHPRWQVRAQRPGVSPPVCGNQRALPLPAHTGRPAKGARLRTRSFDRPRTATRAGSTRQPTSQEYA